MTTGTCFGYLRQIFLSLFFLALIILRPSSLPRTFSRVTPRLFLAWQRNIYRPLASEILVQSLLRIEIGRVQLDILWSFEWRGRTHYFLLRFSINSGPRTCGGRDGIALPRRSPPCQTE